MVQDSEQVALEHALALSESEAIAAATAAVAVAESSAAADDSDSDLPEASRHAKTLIQSFITLLMEQSIIDKELLTNKNPTLQAITLHVEDWIDWRVEDQRFAAAEAAAAELAAQEAEEFDLYERAVAEAVVDGVEPPPAPEKKKALPEEPISSSIALQLKDAPQGFVRFLLEECLINLNPITFENECRFHLTSSRRIGFTLIEIMCQGHESNTRLMLDWVNRHHGTGKQDRIRAEIAAGTYLADDEWDLDPSLTQKSHTGFVGLKNQAATCYQNSLFQHLFNSIEFRKELMALREPEMAVNQDEFKIDGEENHVDSSSSPPLSLLARIQIIFYYLSHSCRRSYDPLDFVLNFPNIDGRPFNPKEQQDVLEFCNLLFERLENGVEGLESIEPQKESNHTKIDKNETNLMKKYFRGQYQNELLCCEYPSQPTHRRINHEYFYVMSLDIHGCNSLTKCLDKFVQGDMLDGGYMCEKCGCKRETKKRCIIHTWPRSVIFHLKRFDFDFELLKTKKLNDEVSFPLEIDLEPYTESGMARRDAEDALKKSLSSDASEVGLTVEEYQQLQQFQHDVDEELDLNVFQPCFKCSRQASKYCKTCSQYMCEIHETEAHGHLGRMPEADQPKSKLQYRLSGVLIHSGHAEGGHYYSYIRTRPPPYSTALGSESSSWHEFNDTFVTEFSPDGLAREAFGGLEDSIDPSSDGNTTATGAAANGEEMNGMAEVLSKKGKKKRKQQDEMGEGEEDWRKKLEKVRNAYLLWYELIDTDAEAEAEAAAARSKQESDESFASSNDQNVSNGNSSSSSAAASSSSTSSVSHLTTALATLAIDDDPTQLPSYLRSIDDLIRRENRQQLSQEVLLDNMYLECIFKLAQRNIDWLPIRDSKDTFDGTSSSTTSTLPCGSRYLQDLTSELDPSDLSVSFIQTLTHFVLETVIRVKENHRIETWFSLLQHAFSYHVGCCQWFLESFILEPKKLVTYLVECPNTSTRKALCGLLELCVKKLIVHEVDPEWSESSHIILPILKEPRKRGDAQAGLAAALAGNGTTSNQTSTAAAASVASSKLAALASPSASSSSSDSFLSSALVQSACVDAQLAPSGLLKSSAHSTVSVSSKIGVLEGIGKGTEKQFGSVGIKTLQQLIEITEAQQEEIRQAPTGGMTQEAMKGFIQKAEQTVEFILELSGVNETLRAEAKLKERRVSAASSTVDNVTPGFSGPRILPAFFRSCYNVYQSIIDDRGLHGHTCPELSTMLQHLLNTNKKLCTLMLEGGIVDAVIDFIISPITTVQQAKEDLRLAREERAIEKAAEAAARGDEIKEDGDDGDGADDDDVVDGDDEDFMTDLEDLSYVELIGLLDTVLKLCCTKSIKLHEPIRLLEGVALNPETLERFQSIPFLKRLILQVSPLKPDPPVSITHKLVWENMTCTDRVIDEIFEAIEERDFFDFYAAIKILQHILEKVQDSLQQYRIELVMPRLLKVTKENQEYYKATELCIKGMIHIVQHVPLAALWLKSHENDIKWMDAWLGKNKTMPKLLKDPEALSEIPEGIAKYSVKGGKTDGVNTKWEKNWNDQIEEYGIGLGLIDNLTDYQRIFKKMILTIKLAKPKTT